MGKVAPERSMKSTVVRVFDMVVAPCLRWLNRIKFTTPVEMFPTQNVLIYCPSIAGHRPMYASRLIDYYLHQGCVVYFAHHGFVAHEHGKKKYVQRSIKVLDAYKNNPRVVFVDMPDNTDPAVDELKLIVELQRQCQASSTIYVDGDELTRTFARQVLPGNPRLLGKNYAVFILSEFFHLRTMPWRNYYKFPRHRVYIYRILFHMLLFRYIDLLDAGLYSDECFVKYMNNDKFRHLPEIGHRPGNPETDPVRISLYTRLAAEYQAFLDRNPSREVLLCFGDLEPRKGFDLLTRLAAERDDVVLVRVGRIKQGYSPTWAVTFNKEKLFFEGRLFEIDYYIDNQDFMDLLFESTRYILLPYDNHFRTSSVMIQALSYGKPLMVANRGLMNYRVRANHLGVAYKNRDYDDFAATFSAFKEEVESFVPKVRLYYEREFSPETFNSRLEETLPNAHVINAPVKDEVCT